MKRLVLVLVCLFSFNVFANLECDINLDGARALIEVDRPTFSGQRYVNARAHLYMDNDYEVLYFNAYIDPMGARRYEFRLTDIGFRVNINTFPDRFPVVGRTYFGEVEVEEFGIDEMNAFCRFDRMF